MTCATFISSVSWLLDRAFSYSAVSDGFANISCELLEYFVSAYVVRNVLSIVNTVFALDEKRYETSLFVNGV